MSIFTEEQRAQLEVKAKARTKPIPVSAIRKGDVLEVHGGYHVKVLKGPSEGADRFGRGMLKFDVRILSSPPKDPDRTGDIGPLIFGPEGVTKKVMGK